MLAYCLFLCLLIGSTRQRSQYNDTASNVKDTASNVKGFGSEHDGDDGNGSDDDGNVDGHGSDNDGNDDGNGSEKDGNDDGNGSENDGKDDGNGSENDGKDDGNGSENDGKDDGNGSENDGKDDDTKTNVKGHGNETPGFFNTSDVMNYAVIDNVENYQERVTLDPETANSHLLLSADWKTVTFANTSQNLDNNTKRFDTDPCVLGSQGYNSGKHYFRASGDAGYLVGFFTEGGRRKGVLKLSRDAGLYFFVRSKGDDISTVGALLDCDQKRVFFYNADTKKIMDTYPISTNDKMFPFIFVGVGQVRVD
ncbi:uncharacterized protein [Ambystoma mexicanum]|uniref:uncharacterized protein isoform X4 n=1 Tax=Ambystoma mexicanum TaxID=8296 RepID=UPI0037E81B00